jgi:hypothetical protein
MQKLNMTKEEKILMYEKLNKKELIEMLINANNVIDKITPKLELYPNNSNFNQINNSPNVSDCLHDNCLTCKGSGLTNLGHTCVHMMSCNCKKCIIT